MNLRVYFTNSGDFNIEGLENISFRVFDIKSVKFTTFITRFGDSCIEISLKVNKGKEYKCFIAVILQSDIKPRIKDYKFKKYLSDNDIILITKELTDNAICIFISSKYYYKPRNYAGEKVLYSREINL